jgi:hypothetical protein
VPSTQMGHHVRKYVSLSSVDAGSKEIVLYCGERGKEEGCYCSIRHPNSMGMRDIWSIYYNYGLHLSKPPTLIPFSRQKRLAAKSSEAIASFIYFHSFLYIKHISQGCSKAYICVGP